MNQKKAEKSEKKRKKKKYKKKNSKIKKNNEERKKRRSSRNEWSLWFRVLWGTIGCSWFLVFRILFAMDVK